MNELIPMLTPSLIPQLLHCKHWRAEELGININEGGAISAGISR